MENDRVARFVVGQKVEARSFLVGFRSAWFRCEVKEIGQRQGKAQALLDYIDYTEQKPLFLILYQNPPYGSKSKNKRKTLMLRPEYPSICHENQIADVNTLQDVVLVVNGVWKVGDMVDWFNTDCYWSGRLTEILGADKAKIELILPPVGEGSCYVVSVEDLRPTLEWSIESGWTVPISKDHEESCCCARLIHPTTRLIHPTRQEYAVVTNRLDKRISQTGEFSTKRQSDEGCPDKSIGEASDIPPDDKRISLVGELAAIPPNELCTDGSIGEASVGKRTFEALHQLNGSYQDMMKNEGVDSVEASVLGLEELLNKVKWLKRILNVDVPLLRSGRPSWGFVEHHG